MSCSSCILDAPRLLLDLLRCDDCSLPRSVVLSADLALYRLNASMSPRHVERRRMPRGPVRMSGWLYKESKYLKTFRKRFCVLIGSSLFCMKQPEDLTRGVCTEAVDLGTADYMVEWDLMPRVRDWRSVEGMFAFEIGTQAETPARREWMFCASTELERRRWLHALGGFCRNVWRPDNRCLEGRSMILSEDSELHSLHLSPRKVFTSDVAFEVPYLSPAESGGSKTRQPTESSCAVCFKHVVGEKVWVLTCGHYFCEDCISQWSHYKRTCPICREVF